MKEVKNTEQEKESNTQFPDKLAKAVYIVEHDLSLWDESEDLQWVTVAGNKFYTLHEYYEQAWLEVPLEEVFHFNIQDQISPYSFYKGSKVYLSREDDMDYFVQALRQSGKDFKTKASYLSQWPFFLKYTPFELPITQENK